MGHRLLGYVVWGLGLLLVIVTALPLVPSNDWAIRIWDFPRLQIAALLALALAATVAVLGLRRWPARALGVALLLSVGWQAWRIWPYTPLHPVVAGMVASCEERSKLDLLVANVLYSNDDAGPLLEMVRRTQPDVVLLVETDADWARMLEPLRASYPHVVDHPRPGGEYGFFLLSRFGLVDPQVRHLLPDYVPSLKTGLRLPSGALVDLYGVHPKPPPLSDTARRDAELLIVAREVREGDRPAVVAGDLNDVAWSRTTRLFQETSGLLDPRIGRGPYPTFNAHWPLLRWPLDHVFFTQGFMLLDMAVMGHIGSDHFPLRVRLCHDPAAGRRQDAPSPEPSDLRDAREAIQEGREEARER